MKEVQSPDPFVCYSKLFQSDGRIVINVPFSKKLVELIKVNRDRFTPQQNVFADFLITHSDQLAFQPVAVMAKMASVSESTIVRFCRQIGYKGYAEFTNEIQQGIQLELTAIQRFRLGKNHAVKSSAEDEIPFFSKLLNNSIDNLTKFAERIDPKEYNRCLELMRIADRFCIIGCLESEGMANHMGLLLRKLNHRTDVINYESIQSFSCFEKLTEKSIVFLLTFPRYSTTTCKLANIALKKEATLVSITNSPLSPTVPLSEISFFVPCAIPSFTNDYTAVMSFVTTICSDLGNRETKISESQLKKFDSFAKEINAHTNKC